MSLRKKDQTETHLQQLSQKNKVLLLLIRLPPEVQWFFRPHLLIAKNQTPSNLKKGVKKTKNSIVFNAGIYIYLYLSIHMCIYIYIYIYIYTVYRYIYLLCLRVEVKDTHYGWDSCQKSFRDYNNQIPKNELPSLAAKF